METVAALDGNMDYPDQFVPPVIIISWVTDPNMFSIFLKQPKIEKSLPIKSDDPTSCAG
jgi:hypothetical protein